MHALRVASVFACARGPVSRVSRDCLGADKVDNHSGLGVGVGVGLGLGVGVTELKYVVF